MQSHLNDTFKTMMAFWKILGIHPDGNLFRYYSLYSKVFILFFVALCDLFMTINLYYIPIELDVIISETIFYFAEQALVSKILTLTIMRTDIVSILSILDSSSFRPDNNEGILIIENAKRFIKRFFNTIAFISLISNFTLNLPPLLAHLFKSVKLELPVCSYSFLSENFTDAFIYPLYSYQAMSLHFQMWYNVNIDSFFLGLMILFIAQLEILNLKLRTVSDKRDLTECIVDDVTQLNECIMHYDKVFKLCQLIQKVFSVTLFIQFSMASCVICVCLVRLTMPAPLDYYIFLATFVFVMIAQILAPCWFGNRIIDKSASLSIAVYSCNWIAKSKEFKSNMRVFIERANRPLSITGGKMFLLSLTTFSSIMNTAYSFFTLIRHMQTREE